MGEVYLAHQVGVGNRVAVKFLALPPGASEAYSARFLAEARVGVTLTHPGIAQVLDAGSEPDGTLFIVFEYADGEDLRHHLAREGHFTWARAKEIISKVGEALAFAHSRGVVHRDIKPENIRVRTDLVGTHVKVLDFGIARLSGDARLTAEGSFSGTPAYMAPEQALGEDVDGRADIYCLGLLLFELLSGRQAVDVPSPAAALMAQLEAPLPRLGDVSPRASPAIDAFLARACAKRPADRFADVVSFLRALHELPAPA
jgi:serine/threonine-protein kinase